MKLVRGIVAAMVLGAALAFGLLGGGGAAHPMSASAATCTIPPATLAYYQAYYLHYTGQTLTCDQLMAMWSNGTYWPR